MEENQNETTEEQTTSFGMAMFKFGASLVIGALAGHAVEKGIDKFASRRSKKVETTETETTETE